MVERNRNMTDLIRLSMNRILEGTYVLEPCRVTEYDHTKQMASIQPLLKRTPNKKIDDITGELVPGTPELLPIIQGVPVLWPRISVGTTGPQAHIYMPMKPNTNVMVLFSDRSLDKWLSTGGEVDPQDTRAHALSDAVALPGLFPFNDPIPDVDPSDIRIVLKWPERGIDCEIILGGDTNNIILRPGNQLMLGASNADQSAILGELFKAVYEGHFHPDPVSGFTGVPTVPLPATVLSAKVKIKDNT